mgnify:CR=1 FL=1
MFNCARTQLNSACDIERPTGQCAYTGRVLEPGEDYIATLVELDLSQPSQGERPTAGSAPTGLGLKRLDVSLEAWEQGSRPDNLFGYWRTTVAQPNEKRKLFVDNDILMNLFRRLEDAQEDERLAFRFVLGMILMRKKLLRYDGTEKRQAEDAEGNTVTQDWWLVTPKLDLSKGPLGKWNDAGRMAMLDPHMDEQRIVQVTEQLGQILEAEL